VILKGLSYSDHLSTTVEHNVTVRGAPLTEFKRSSRTLKKQNFKTANGRRVPLTDLLGSAIPAKARVIIAAEPISS